MTRFACLLAVAAFVASGSLSCSSSSESSRNTTEQQTTQDDNRADRRAQPPRRQYLLRPRNHRRRPSASASTRSSRACVIAASRNPLVYQQVARRENIDVDSVILIEREGSLRRWKLPAAPKLPDAAVRAPPSRVAAKRLRSSVRCSSNAPRTGIASLRWRPVRRPGRRQWIAVTIFLRGFALGKLRGIPPARQRRLVVRVAARARTGDPLLARDHTRSERPLARKRRRAVHGPDLHCRVRAVVSGEIGPNLLKSLGHMTRFR